LMREGSPEFERRSPRTSTLVNLAALAVVVGALHLGKEVLIPFALAVLLAFLLTPLASTFERLRLGRIPAVALCMLLAVSVLGSTTWLVLYQMSELTEDLPEHRTRILERIQSIQRGLSIQNEKVKGVLETLGEAIQASEPGPEGAPKEEAQAIGKTPEKQPSTSPFALSSEDRPIFVRVIEEPPQLLRRLYEALSPLLVPLGTACVVVVLTIFMLLQRENLRDRSIRLIGGESLSAPAQAINDAASRVSRYLIVQSTINGSYGAMVGVGLFFLGAPSWALWGFLAGVLRFLPYFGLWIGAIPPVLLILLTTEGWTRPLLAVALFALTDLTAYLVCEPWFFGLSTGVSPFAILLAAVFWTWLWGPIGLLLATPLTVCLVVLGQRVPHLRPLSTLLGDAEPLKPHERLYQRLLSDETQEGAEAVVQRARESQGLSSAYDDVVAPALRLAECEKEAGHLSKDRYESVLENARDLVEALGAAAEPPQTEGVDRGSLGERRRVACVPAHDEPDDIAVSMLAQLCERAGREVYEVSPLSLVGEIVEGLGKAEVEMVCVVTLRGAGRRHARALCKRLRKRWPELIVVKLVWGARERPVSPAGCGDSECHAYAASASEALAKIEALGLPRSHAPPRAAAVKEPALQRS